MKKSSVILRLAAQELERHENCVGGCTALSHVIGLGQFELAMKHFALVAPRADSDCSSFWWVAGPRGGGFLMEGVRARHPNARNARIVGLCLAAAIAESEGD